MLGYYAERFSTTEVNYTFRRIPSEKTLRDWVARTPDHFRFSLKAPQRVTHFAKLRDSAETVRFFRDQVAVLGTKLGTILFQLPPTMKRDVAVLSNFLQQLPPATDAAFEFRHDSWFADDVFITLREANAALCIADAEGLTTPLKQTADFSYFRLRREDYTGRDLTRWAKVVQEHAETARSCHVYFKHEDTGIGPKFAAQLGKKLRAPTVGKR